MAEKKVIEIQVKTGNAQKNVEKLNNDIKKTQKETKKASGNAKELSGTLNAATSGVAGRFGGILTSIKSVITGFKSLRVAIIGTGIGALVIGILALIQAFKRSEEGQNKFAKILGVIGSVTENLLDILADLGEFIISVFEDPKKAINDFVKLLKENVSNRIEGLLELIPNLGRAIKLLFEGNFSEAGKVAADALGKVTLGIESVTESTQNAINKTKEFIAELQREAKIAAEIADQRAKADVIERGLIVKRAEANRKIAELRDKATRKDLFSLAERKKALIEASDINETITNQEIEAAKLRRDAIIEENKLSKSNKEALAAEEQAKAKVIELETKRLNLQKRLGAELSSINNQQAAEAKARRKKRDEEAKKEEETEKKRLDSIQKVRDKFNKQNEDLNAKSEEDKLELERQRAQAEIDLIVGTETEKREAQLAVDALFNNKEDELAKKRKAEKDAQDEIDKQKQIEREEAVAEARKTIQDQNIKNALNGIKLLTSVFGKSKALQAAGIVAENAVGIAKTVINTQSANAAAKLKYALLPGGQALAAAEIAANKVSAGISIATSVAATAKALSQLGKGGNANAGGAGNLGGGGGQAEAPAPAFNLIGQGGGINQIDQSLQQEQQPIQAFVVSGNVTSAQELDRNIVDTATIV